MTSRRRSSDTTGPKTPAMHYGCGSTPNTSIRVVPVPRTSALRSISWLRLQDILVLQGPPLLGAAFAVRHPNVRDLGPLATLFAGNVLLMAHVFMLNDRAGLHADLADPNKASGVFTVRGVG